MLLVYITHDFTREGGDNTNTNTIGGSNSNNSGTNSSICYRREVLLAAVHMLLDSPL